MAQPASLRSWDSVSGCLEHDHRVMDAILTDVEVFAHQGDVRVLAEYFAHFRSRLLTHIELEEEIVFPFFESATGSNGPTSVMRREHETIRQLLDAVHGSLSRADAAADRLMLLDELATTLDRHDEKEERVIYPAVDAGARRSGELLRLVARVEAFLEGLRG